MRVLHTPVNNIIPIRNGMNALLGPAIILVLVCYSAFGKVAEIARAVETTSRGYMLLDVTIRGEARKSHMRKVVKQDNHCQDPGHRS